MTHHSGAAKKHHSSPPFGVLEAGAGPPELEARGPTDETYTDEGYTEESARWPEVAIRRASMLVVGAIPFAVLLFASENNSRHYASPDVLVVFGGVWAIFALWIILDKGPDSVMTKDALGTAWLWLGLSNLIGAVLLFVSVLLEPR